MNKINYQSNIFYTKNRPKFQKNIFYKKNKPKVISFYGPYGPEHDVIIDLSRVISFYIEIDPNPILKLDCHSYDLQTSLHEYAIDYIIKNKIGKYNNFKLMKHYGSEYYSIITYFDIIDKELLIQLL